MYRFVNYIIEISKRAPFKIRKTRACIAFLKNVLSFEDMLEKLKIKDRERTKKKRLKKSTIC